MIFQNRIYSLKYQKFTTLGYKDMWTGQLEIVTKTQLLLEHLIKKFENISNIWEAFWDFCRTLDGGAGAGGEERRGGGEGGGGGGEGRSESEEGEKEADGKKETVDEEKEEIKRLGADGRFVNLSCNLFQEQMNIPRYLHRYLEILIKFYFSTINFN